MSLHFSGWLKKISEKQVQHIFQLSPLPVKFNGSVMSFPRKLYESVSWACCLWGVCVVTPVLRMYLVLLHQCVQAVCQPQEGDV